MVLGKLESRGCKYRSSHLKVLLRGCRPIQRPQSRVVVFLVHEDGGGHHHAKVVLSCARVERVLNILDSLGAAVALRSRLEVGSKRPQMLQRPAKKLQLLLVLSTITYLCPT